MYRATTRNIDVAVAVEYMPGESAPDQGRWFFGYTIEITNRGEATVKLLSRRWEITDGRGETQVVEGPGVVGKQPVLAPGASFRYSSGCALQTPHGIMVGHYIMRGEDGQRFLVDVPAFSLDAPKAPRVLN